MHQPKHRRLIIVLFPVLLNNFLS
ncbi:hypothetical protein DWB61_09315 [Ancylomarina euxinus]|uniref:Uncharacterized protein n=1 Tax=Ancylomarina euxinus TaxID=2283627 RepID=A0A425Y1Z3_9BACT|nr:hypothetical protein [Ancylomarina euxinus]RRG21948.1 hypothetical protein DWB61_09315 [Ancylomarina euxinus]